MRILPAVLEALAVPNPSDQGRHREGRGREPAQDETAGFRDGVGRDGEVGPDGGALSGRPRDLESDGRAGKDVLRQDCGAAGSIAKEEWMRAIVAVNTGAGGDIEAIHLQRPRIVSAGKGCRLPDASRDSDGPLDRALPEEDARAVR